MGSVLSAASSDGPRISIGTSAECLSAETNPLFPAAYGDLTFATAPSFDTPTTTACTAALNSASIVVSVSLWTSTSSPAGCLKSSYRIVSARPDFPRPGLLGDDRPHRRDDADREQHDREREPAADGLLAVLRAPPGHSGREVVRALHG